LEAKLLPSYLVESNRAPAVGGESLSRGLEITRGIDELTPLKAAQSGTKRHFIDANQAHSPKIKNIKNEGWSQ
jgi:hypothetical protein